MSKSEVMLWKVRNRTAADVLLPKVSLDEPSKYLMAPGQVITVDVYLLKALQGKVEILEQVMPDRSSTVENTIENNRVEEVLSENGFLGPPAADAAPHDLGCFLTEWHKLYCGVFVRAGQLVDLAATLCPYLMQGIEPGSHQRSVVLGRLLTHLTFDAPSPWRIESQRRANSTFYRLCSG